MKKFTKALVVFFLSAIIIYSSIMTVNNAVMFSKINKTTLPSGETRSIEGLETTYHDFYEKYRSMKKAFSENSDFIDLIPACDFGATLDGVKDKFDNPNISVDVYIFYQRLIDEGFIEVTEGRCIDINHNGEDGIEIMVPSDLDVSVGDKITLSLSLYDENGKSIKLNSTVVGKYKKYKPFFFPKEALGTYMENGEYDPNIIVQNIVDYVDFTAFTYGYEDGDYAIKDPYNHNIRLLPVFKNHDTGNINLLYEVANSNDATVFQDTHYEWQDYVGRLYDYLRIAVVSAVVTVFAAATLIIFIKYNFRRKNDNTVKEQPQGVSQG